MVTRCLFADDRAVTFLLYSLGNFSLWICICTPSGQRTGSTRKPNDLTKTRERPNNLVTRRTFFRSNLGQFFQWGSCSRFLDLSAHLSLLFVRADTQSPLNVYLTSELVALIAISSTFFLFLHTRDLNTRLREMEVKLQPDDLVAANQIVSGDSGPATSTRVRTMMKLLQSTGKLQMTSLEPYQLNNTRRAKQEILFFNRVPKVGSQTFMELLRLLSMRNNYEFHQDQVQRVETIRLAPDDQARLAELISSYEPPSVYIKHVCFTNFSEFGIPEPIYVNLVRDPVERVISWYYYVRAPWYYVERKIAFPDIPLPDPKWLKKDFDNCVLSGDRECRYLTGETREGIGDHRRQSMFFCGHHEDCTPFNTDGALERAKRAVDEHYAVVGILEDLNTTLTVLEHYIPRFFEGATDVYYNEIRKYNTINRNLFKPPVSEEVKDIVRRNFTKEIEFYEFCKQRLHKQYYALKLPDKH